MIDIKDKLKEISNIENKYGLILFRMGLTYLMEAGHMNLSNDGYVEGCIKQIMAQGEIDEANGKKSIMTPEFQCGIVRCAAELTQFSPWVLFGYIKKHVVISS